VLGGLVVADVEVAAEPLEDLVAAHDGAQRVRADAHVMRAHRPTLVHRVEGRDGADLGLGEVEDLRAGGDALGRDAPLGGLHQVQHRQQGAACLRIAPRQLAQLVERGLAQRVGNLLGHRSTPPITGSIEATATMTSESMPPSLIAETPWRLTNEGSRKWTRNGRVPPSDTAWQAISPLGDSTGK